MIRLLGLAAVLATTAAAQTDGRGPLYVCRLPATTETVAAGGAEARRVAPDCNPETEGARFDVTYSGFPDEAQAAFQAAVDTWSCRIASSQTIRIAARWSGLEPATLGSAGPYLYRNFPNAPSRDVWYPAALADGLAGRDLGDGDPDIDAVFNADFGAWHFDAGSPPEGTYDLYTVVLHEIGHGLGLIGAMTVEDGLGYVGLEPGGPYTYDLHTQDGQGRPLVSGTRYPSGSAALAAALTGDVEFTGLAISEVIGAAVPLYAPSRWVDGGSYSHLDEETFLPNTPDGLMTPFIARQEVIAEPGTVECAMLADIGWTLAGDCADRVGTSGRVNSALTARRLGPNPVSDRTTVQLSSDAAIMLHVQLLDVLGRRVVDYGSAVLVDGQRDVVVDASPLASGSYFLVASGAAETVVVRFTVLR